MGKLDLRNAVQLVYVSDSINDHRFLHARISDELSKFRRCAVRALQGMGRFCPSEKTMRGLALRSFSGYIAKKVAQVSPDDAFIVEARSEYPIVEKLHPESLSSLLDFGTSSYTPEFQAQVLSEFLTAIEGGALFQVNGLFLEHYAQHHPEEYLDKTEKMILVRSPEGKWCKIERTLNGVKLIEANSISPTLALALESVKGEENSDALQQAINHAHRELFKIQLQIEFVEVCRDIERWDQIYEDLPGKLDELRKKQAELAEKLINLGVEINVDVEMEAKATTGEAVNA